VPSAALSAACKETASTSVLREEFPFWIQFPHFYRLKIDLPNHNPHAINHLHAFAAFLQQQFKCFWIDHSKAFLHQRARFVRTRCCLKALLQLRKPYNAFLNRKILKRLFAFVNQRGFEPGPNYSGQKFCL
jgi:hypothetical protein